MEIAFRILWTDLAVNQLKDIFDYHYIKASPVVAKRLVKSILDATVILHNNPKSGRKEDLLLNRPQEFRFVIVKNFKIIYWIDNDFNIVNIATVFDTRQNPEKISNIK